MRKFDILRDFCGGIATIFLNTATVESDFSVLGWEKNEYRQSLTDLSLEGIMQCKQFELLSKLDIIAEMVQEISMKMWEIKPEFPL